MKPTFLFFIMLFTLKALTQICSFNSVTTGGGTPDYCDQDWQIVLEEDFNSLNYDNWIFKPDGKKPTDRTIFQNGKHEGEIYLEDNVEVKDGKLILTAKRQNYDYSGTFEDNFNDAPELVGNIGDEFQYNFKYTSGMIKSRNTFKLRNGLKIEARIKYPIGNGLWPAFWSWGHDEIDYFEVFNSGSDNTFASTLHNNGYTNRCGKTSSVPSNDFHIWTAEVTTNEISVYIDGNLIHKFYRYYTVSGQEFEPCNYFPFANYTELKSYPYNDFCFNVIINLAVNRDIADSEDVTNLPAKMEVDWIKIYTLTGCDNVGQNITISEDTEMTLSQVFEKITVKSGKTLTITNGYYSFDQGGEIVLEDGANLILDKTVLMANKFCGLKWNGIIGENCTVELKNHSKISEAKNGIKLKNSILKMDSYSGIELCTNGILLEGNCEESHIQGDCWIKNNDTGIMLLNSTGLVLDRLQCYENKEAIRAIDSYVRVRDGNSFHGGETGIALEGTFPGSTGVDIGDLGQGWNYFASDINLGIRSQGADHPTGANIVNCRFDNPTNGGILLYGENYYNCANNTIQNSSYGIWSVASGDNYNYVRCNNLNDLGVGSGFLWNNKGSQFLGNVYSNISTNCAVYSAEIANNVGSPLNPAGNCFSDNSDGIYVFNSSVFGTSSPFNYHFYTQEECQKPTNPVNFTALSSEFPSKQCESAGVIIFDEIDPDGDGEDGINYENYPSCTYHIPKDDVIKNIIYFADIVLQDGGDDPRTEQDESTNTPTSVLPVHKDKILDQWIRYAIFRGQQDNDLSFIETVLIPLKKTKWQRQLYGNYVLNGKLDKAHQVLVSLPNKTRDDIIFKKTQEINLSLKQGNIISPKSIDNLKTFALSKYPSSAYARSLYRLLTGELLQYQIPDIKTSKPNESVKSRSIANSTISSNISIIPNPVEDILFIQSDIEITRVTITDVSGLTHIDRLSTSTIDLESLANGLYFIKIQTADGNHCVKQFVKN